MENKIYDLVAVRPHQMENAAAGLAEWATAMRDAMSPELRDLETEHEIAKRNKWRVNYLATRIRVTRRRVLFYDKIREAVKEGYVLVPNFMMDTFALRVPDAAALPRGGVEFRSFRGRPAFNQPIAFLPSGEGDHVSVEAVITERSGTETVDGKEKALYTYKVVEHGPVEFPVSMAKPQIMEATEKALALKLFDEIGISREWAGGSGKGDPMILGRFRNPRASRPDVTFFIAWRFQPDRI